jgi:hypothetical protein
VLQTLLIICISPALVVVAWAEPSPTPDHITSRLPRQSVQSSAIAKVGYSKRRHILEIEFVNGAVYRYFDIPLSVYHDLISAESKARFYDSNIRKHYRSVLVRQRQKQESPKKSPAPRRAYGAGCHSRGDQFRAESGKHRTSFNISATNNDNGHELAVLPRTAAMKRVFSKA